jgi:large subunit ribosomal protein L2
MALKTFRPYTPSRRFLTMLDKSEITKETPEKSLSESKKRTGGRNSHGEVTSWHRGGGHAKRYRTIDFRREKTGIPAKVAAIESRCCITRTARSATSCIRWASKSA